MCWSVFFFFKQKTAYEMRISDWSSDVCSSALRAGRIYHHHAAGRAAIAGMDLRLHRPALAAEEAGGGFCLHRREGDNAPRDGHAVALQQPLRLIFMNVHRSLSCSLTDYWHTVYQSECPGNAHGDRKSTRLNSSH